MANVEINLIYGASDETVILEFNSRRAANKAHEMLRYQAAAGRTCSVDYNLGTAYFDFTDDRPRAIVIFDRGKSNA